MRALATCVMTELCALYGMCWKADTYAAHETCMDLSITMYLRPSLAAADSPRMVNVFSCLRPAKLRSSQGMYSAGHVSARGTRAFIDAGRTPERACGTLDRLPGGFCRMIRVPFSVWAIDVISWGRSEVCRLFEMAVPETK